MVLIENKKQFKNFNQIINNKRVVILPVLIDHEKHYCNNFLSLLFIRIVDTNKDFLISINHSEADSVPIELINEMKPSEIWTTNKKHLQRFLKIDDIQDVNMLNYLVKNSVIQWDTETNAHNFLQRKLNSKFNLNRIIPIIKHIEILKKNADKVVEIINEIKKCASFDVYMKYLNTAYKIESNGICVNRNKIRQYFSHKKLDKHITKNNLIFSEYNLYTSTGRPSNAFGGLNFAGIIKNDGSREIFVPSNDVFLMFDYSSFHLNLIAKLLDYKFNDDNIHKYLAKNYYKINILNTTIYNEIKQLNFKYLYGNIPNEIKNKIPYFKKVDDFSKIIWLSIKKDEYYLSPLTKRKIYLKYIDSPSKNKVFNYLIQLMEMEFGFYLMTNIIKFLESFKTKLVLYNFDSFLFDLSFSDGKKMIQELYKIINIFPVKVYIGPDYHNLKEFKNIKK